MPGCLTLARNSVSPARYRLTGYIMDVFALFSARIGNAMQVLFPELGADLLARIVVEPPRDPAHGDLSTNAAMIAAKPLGKNPRDVAAALVEHFRHDADVTSVEVAGPGFI